MHAICENLVIDENQIESPEWHEDELRDTEKMCTIRKGTCDRLRGCKRGA